MDDKNKTDVSVTDENRKHRKRVIRKLQPPRSVGDLKDSDGHTEETTLSLEGIQEDLKTILENENINNENIDNENTDIEDGEAERESEEGESADEDYDLMSDDFDSEAETGRKGGGGLKIVIVACLIVVAVTAGLGVIFYNKYRDMRTEEFQANVQFYRQAVEAYEADGEYLQILDEADKALENRDLFAYSDLKHRMDEAINALENKTQSQQQLAELKDTYEAVFSKYQITDTYKNTYNDLMERLIIAINDNDETEAPKLQQEFEKLRSNLQIENKNLVQSAMNEINAIDVAEANDSEKQTLADYAAQVDGQLADEDYVEALKTLGYWKEMAQLTEKRIRESESEEIARRESEEAARRESESNERETGNPDEENSEAADEAGAAE